IATGVGNDDDLELEPFRTVDRQQPNGIRALLLGDRLELASSDGLLVAHEADEAFHVGSSQLFVGHRKPRELSKIRVPAAAVPLRENGEVVVVLRDDSFAETLERQ